MKPHLSPAAIVAVALAACGDPESDPDAESWTVFRPDGAPAEVVLDRGIIRQNGEPAWLVFDNTGACSFATPVDGSLAGNQWQFSAHGSGCSGYSVQCFAQGQAEGPSASGSIQCNYITPGGPITNEGTWMAVRQ